MNSRGITIVSASAGSGKTYRLTKEVTAAINPKSEDPVPLEGLLAVTYTKKAHAELRARIHHSLVSQGAFTESMRLPLAYLGTVHAACLRLLQEFALDAGLSPTVDVIAEDQAILLRQSLESALTDDQRDRIDGLAHRFRLHYNPQLRRHDWLRPVADIMDLARSNRISPDALPAMAKRSVDGLLGLFPTPLPEAEGDALDSRLYEALKSTSDALAQSRDNTATTAGVIQSVEEAKRRLDDRIDDLDWSDWVRLATLSPAVKSQALVKSLREIAARYEEHPRFHSELRALTEVLFDAARIGLSTYRDWKSARHVVDYVDMLDGALSLVMHPRVRDELSSRLRFTVVDEFQDTSPIQLALFVELHKLAGRSVWVGDRKQCIFEYAGADPMLMDAVAAWVSRAGGERDALATNYRSRPELVNACSELFARALERHGFTRDEVVVAPKRDVPAGLTLPPFGLWCLETKKKEDDAAATAEGVRRLLANPSEARIVDRGTGELRDLRPGDVAILVATNREAREIANALTARGVRSAIARAGLLRTPEGTLADAALRWLLDDGDSLAAATIDVLSGTIADPDAWLAAKLTSPETTVSVWRENLQRVRVQVPLLSPTEALDQVLAALDVVHLCARWPSPAQRIANLDALRGLARRYEDGCLQDREAATVAGLVRYFEELSEETIQRDDVTAFDEQHVPSDDGAVVVMTYHKAKGLEWPVVVLSSLDRGERRDAFDVCPESDLATFDPKEPLAGRWIRYWPWPFGGLQKVPLAERAEAAPEGQGVAQREDKERARLLYVGFTRARDHLVIAARVSKGIAKVPWLDGLRSVDGKPLLELCASLDDGATGNSRIGGGGLEVATRVWRLSAEVAESAEATDAPRRWFARVAATSPRQPYRIAPSSADQQWPDLLLPSVVGVVSLGGAMPVEGKVTEYNVLGDAVHAFLAADVEGLNPKAREARARRLIAAAGLEALVRPASLLEAGDRLRAFVDARWSGAKWHREITIDATIKSGAGDRRLSGAIDLLLETTEGFVLMDHKTFPGVTESAWTMKAIDFLPQMGAYLEALNRQREPVKKVIACWLHFPVGGGAVELSIPNR